MKHLRFLCPLLLAASCVFAAAAALPTATPATPPPASPVELFTALIALATPLLIAVVKYFAPKIPRPLIPWLTPLLGAVLEWLAHAAGLTGGNLLLGAVFGAAGVAVREAVDQLRKQGIALGAAPLPLLLVSLLMLTPGCANFGNRQEDRSIVTHPDGTREERIITSRQDASTLLESKSALTQLKATQTDKTQSLGLGTLSQESQSPQVAQALGVDAVLKFLATPEGQNLLKLLLKTQGVPLP
jgi:hypothetical protein